MPSDADALLITASAAFFSFNAQSANYLPLGASAPLALSAIGGPISQQIEDTDVGRVIVQRREIQVLISDVPTPVRGDTLTFADGLPWTLETAVHQDAAIAVFGAVRIVTTEVTHQNYRNRF